MKSLTFKQALLLSAIFFAAACNSRNDRTGTDTYNQNQAGNTSSSSVRTDTAATSGNTYQGNNTAQSPQHETGTMSSTNTQNNQSNTQNNQNNISANIAGADKDFAMEAYKGGRMEVKMGNMATERAHSVRVKNFAQM